MGCKAETGAVSLPDLVCIDVCRLWANPDLNGERQWRAGGNAFHQPLQLGWPVQPRHI